MRYKDIECAACGERFGETDDVVVCPVCGAPHHRACWMETGRCAMDARHAEGFVWEFPELPAEEPAQPAAPETPDGQTNEHRMKNNEHVVTCPNCGSANFENDVYCMRCHARLDGSDVPDEDDVYKDDYREDMDHYREVRSSYDRFGGLQPDAPVDGIPCAEYAEYVGGSRPGRIIRKVSTMERFGRNLSWVWSALIFGPAWFFWRKMKKEGAVISLLLVFLAAFYGVAQLDGPTVRYMQKAYETVMQVASGQLDMEAYRDTLEELRAVYYEEEEAEYSPARAIGVNVLFYCLICGLPAICAFIAMPLYRRKVKNHILEIRGECASMEEYFEALRTQGGTSPAGAVAGALVLAAAVFCAVYLPMILAITLY